MAGVAVELSRMRSIGLPLLHEEEVEGVVSSVFVDIRARMPFVPALFKALAADPESLVAAWLQARMIYDDPGAPAAADEIRTSAQVSIDFRLNIRVSEALAPYVTELPFRLLIVTSLRLSLSGELARQPPPELDLQRRRPSPSLSFLTVPSIPCFRRSAWSTEHSSPSIFRALAANGLLADTWNAIGPFLASSEGAAAVARVVSEAENRARAMPEVASFAVESARPNQTGQSTCAKTARPLSPARVALWLNQAVSSIIRGRTRGPPVQIRAPR